mgnify:CR=1 FL=1|tara:strand:+ start:232 stop:1413 length:1182 start_codon:yes stop_codon:yes gene_type:complete
MVQKKLLKMRVGFVINYSHQKWLGGFNIIANLISAIQLLPKENIKPILIVNKKFNKKWLKDFKNIRFIKSDLFANQSLIKRIYNKISILIFGKSYEYDNFFKKNNISALSHTLIPLGKKSLIKSFPWIPDFQYIHYPENFSLKNRIMKNLNNEICAAHSTKIILSSFDVKNDLKKISLKAYKKSEISSFVFDVPSKKNLLSLSKLKKKYKIRSKYFYLPNQYWIHKNHLLVLKSLKEIVKKDSSILIISTGYTDDHRSINYFKKIKKYIDDNNLNDNYIHLGVVPYKDVMSLMFHSVSLINPSKFEGWSSSVEQAKSMGKKIILSNINVHKEQNPRRGIYFEPNNFNKLSLIMIKVWKNFSAKEENKFINIAYKNLKKRLIKYAENYQKIILE